MPWNKSGVLRQLRQAYRKGLPQSEIRKLKKLAREYGATREEIARAKKGTTRR